MAGKPQFFTRDPADGRMTPAEVNAARLLAKQQQPTNRARQPVANRKQTTVAIPTDGAPAPAASSITISTNTPTAETVGATGSAGSSSNAAAADHAHSMPGVFGASGASHSAGFVPDPGSSAGTSRFLREDSTWATPSGGGSGISVWSNGTSYTAGQSLVYGSDGNIYIAAATQSGHDPTADDGTNWWPFFLLASSTSNCGVGQRFADTFASSASPGGAMTPGMTKALTFWSHCGAAVGPAIASVTIQQANNPSTTCSGTGTTTTVLTTVNVPIGSTLLFKGDITAGLAGKTTTVTASSFASGTYTLTVSTLSNTPATNDTFYYAAYYGVNGISVDVPAIASNLTIQGSSATCPMPAFFPSLSTSGTGLTGTYYIALSYTWTDQSGTTRETMPGPVTSLVPSNQGIQIASFSVPSWASGVNVNASNSSGGTFFKQGSMVVSGGTASAYTMSTYSTATASATANPIAVAYPCALMFANAAGITFTNTSGATLNGLYIKGNGSAVGCQFTNSAGNTIGKQTVLSGWADGIRVGSQTTAGGNGNTANSVQVDACSIGVLVYGSSFTANNINVVRCTTQGIYARMGGWNNVQLGNIAFNAIGLDAAFFSANIISPQSPGTGSGSAQYSYGCTTVASPAINTVGNAQSYNTDTINI